MNSLTKKVVAGGVGAAAFVNGMDAHGQDKKIPDPKSSTDSRIVLDAKGVEELTGRTQATQGLLSKLARVQGGSPDFAKFGSIKKAPSIFDRLHAVQSKEGSQAKKPAPEPKTKPDAANKITTDDTPYALTIEEIAAELAEYGLLQTRQEKLDFAKKIQVATDDNVKKGLKHAGKEGVFFLEDLQWLKDKSRDTLFDQKNGFTRTRLINALIKSPDFEEAHGSLIALKQKETNVPFITSFNERLIRRSQTASQTKPTDANLASKN